MDREDVCVASPQLAAKIQEWLDWDQNEVTRKQIKMLVSENETGELEERLMNRLNFGTAGLRGLMAAGYNRMNDLVIIQTTQGLAKYLLKVCPTVKQDGIVLGFDGRHNSHRFARLAAVAFLSCDIKTYLFSKMVPTPFVPYCVCHYNAAAGIMVTASHNPKDDNGYKVYWSNGAQIIAPHDKGIQESILANLSPWPNAWDEQLVETSPLCVDPLKEIMESYFAHLDETMIDKTANSQCKTKFTFTPMHGVSHSYMLQAFKTCNFPPYIPVVEQIMPDPEFPTVKFPNPEEGKSALDLAIKTADMNGSTVILANDPDADRLAIAEKQPDGQWKIYTGNEIGALLGWWLWHCWRKQNPDSNGKDVYMIASTVSSKILRAIAAIEGFNFIETLTGFKWMGNKGHELIKESKTVLFAFEEAIGFMCGSNVLDKDGITAAMKVAEMTAYLEKTNTTLTQQLHKTYMNEINGLKLLKIKSLYRGLNGIDCVQAKGWAIKYVRDLTTGYDSSQPDQKTVLPICKTSQMITFTFANGCVATLRTSGTEPKIKYYTEFCAKPKQDNWNSLEEELTNIVRAIVEDFMQPNENGLTPRSD